MQQKHKLTTEMEMEQIKKEIENFLIPNWAEELGIAITVTDLDDKIIYMNQKSKKTFPTVDIGHNMKNCHLQSSNEIIQNLKAKNISNSYTVQKNGIKKLIHQTPWLQNGEIAGLVEISIEIPTEMIHKNRDAK